MMNMTADGWLSAEADIERVTRFYKPGLLQTTCDQMREQARILNSISDAVEANWERAPEYIKRPLELLAYSFDDERITLKVVARKPVAMAKAIGTVFAMIWRLATLKDTSQMETFLEFARAKQRFQTVVFDAIERSSNRLNEALIVSLTPLSSNHTPTFTAADYVERWRAL